MTEPDGGARTVSSRREAALSDTFVELASTLVLDYDVIDVLDRLVHTCVEILDVAAAGMLLDDLKGGLAVAAASSDDMRTLEVFQAETLEGPCYDCGRAGAAVHSADLREEQRWPQFVDLARSLGYLSVSALPLRLRGQNLGVLGLFRSTVAPFGHGDERLAQAFADVAAVGLLNQRLAHRSTVLAEQLRGALDSRVVIEQAKGVLAERESITTDQAYQRLRQYARSHNLKLTQVALDVVEDRVRLPR